METLEPCNWYNIAMKIKNILILGGGDSTRFWPLGDKNIWLFLKKPLIVHLIESLSKFAENVIVVTNPLNDELVKRLSPVKIQTVIIKDPSQSTMGKAIIECKNTIHGEVLILNAVDILDFNILNELIKKRDQGNEFICVAKKITEYFPGAYIQFDGTSIKGFVEKPDPDKVPSDMTKLVVDYFSDFSQLVTIMEETSTPNDDLYEQAINSYIKRVKKLDYVTYDDYWHTLKYSWHVLPMMRHFLSTITEGSQCKNVSISKTALIVGPVQIGDNVKIGDFTKIVGPTYIGDNSMVGDHALVRESHVGNNVLIGGGSEVARSYLSDGVMIHRNYVGDSVLSEKVLMGAGAVTANFRFDGKTVPSMVEKKRIDSQLNKFGAIIGKRSKIGVNCTLLPGIKIGNSTCIGPGEVIKEDVGDNIFLFK